MLQKENAGTKSQPKAQLWSKPTQTYIINKPNSKNPHETTSKSPRNHQRDHEERVYPCGSQPKNLKTLDHHQRKAKPQWEIKCVKLKSK